MKLKEFLDKQYIKKEKEKTLNFSSRYLTSLKGVENMYKNVYEKSVFNFIKNKSKENKNLVKESEEEWKEIKFLKMIGFKKLKRILNFKEKENIIKNYVEIDNLIKDNTILSDQLFLSYKDLNNLKINFNLKSSFSENYEGSLPNYIIRELKNKHNELKNKWGDYFQLFYNYKSDPDMLYPCFEGHFFDKKNILIW